MTEPGTRQQIHGDSSTARSAARCAVLLSGSGRTLDNLLRAVGEGRVAATIAAVIASKECLGATKARNAQIPTFVMPGQIPAADLERVLNDHRIDLVVCAGYLKYLHVPHAYSGRVVNIHPSLLPKFGGAGMYGDRVHEAVIRAGETISGCTVHLVDEVYDHGRILLQRTCPVLPGDTPRTLADRVFEQECLAYPEALQRLLNGDV